MNALRVRVQFTAAAWMPFNNAIALTMESGELMLVDPVVRV